VAVSAAGVAVADLMHIWASLLRTYLDQDMRRDRARLLGWCPPAMYPPAARNRASCCTRSRDGCTLSYSYVAIYHFVSQNYGFLAIYKARAGER
jgi:hypothetical protein